MTQTVSPSLITNTSSIGGASTSQQTFNPFLLNVMETDLQNVFFNGSDFNETVTIYHSLLGRWESYSGDFDDPSTTIDFGADADMSDLMPQVMIPNYALAAKITKADKIVVRGTKYIVENINNDGVGVTTVMLRRR